MPDQNPSAVNAKLGHSWNTAIADVFKRQPDFSSYGNRRALYAPKVAADVTASYGGKTLTAEEGLPEFFKSLAEVEEWKSAYPKRAPTSRRDLLDWIPDPI